MIEKWGRCLPSAMAGFGSLRGAAAERGGIGMVQRLECTVSRAHTPSGPAVNDVGPVGEPNSVLGEEMTQHDAFVSHDYYC